jgi:hypothetical protein
VAHGQELIGHAFHWPGLVGRLWMAGLIVGFPLAIALAWYHGHKGTKQLGAREVSLISLLLLIGAGLLIALVLVSVPDRADASLIPLGDR